MNCYLFHKWEYLVCPDKNDARHANAYFRYCIKCHKWQREFSCWGDSWWEDSNAPNVEHLIPKDEFERKALRLEMEENSICCKEKKLCQTQPIQSPKVIEN